MSALFTPTLRSQREFVGSIDATRDNVRATARSLEQTQGGQRSSCARIVPLPDTRTPAQEAGELVALVFGLVLIVGTPIYCYFT